MCNSQSSNYTQGVIFAIELFEATGSVGSILTSCDAIAVFGDSIIDTQRGHNSLFDLIF